MHRRAARCTPALTIAVALWTVAARADVVMPEPTSCPEGSTAATCHGGPHCRPTPCVDSSSCKNGSTCQDVKWCIGQIDCRGGWRSDASYAMEETVEAACEGNATCSKGTCLTIKVCTTAGAPQARGCTCTLATASTDGRAPGWMALTAVVLVLWRRGRRR
jgi:MYXO-CTERM domain-containing protein